MIYGYFGSILVLEDNGKQTLNIKNMFLIVTAINYYAMMISLTSLLSHN